MRIRLGAAALLAFAGASGGAGAHQPPATEFRPVKAGTRLDPALTGVWRNEADGWLLDLTGREPVLYNETSADCLRDRASGSDILDYVASEWRGARDRIWVRAGADLPVYRFERIAALPGACRTTSESTPTAVFNSLVASYSDHYPHFRERGIDWAAAVAAARPQLHDDMSDAELFALLTSLLRPLDDSHVTLSDPAEPELYFEEGVGRTLRSWFNDPATPGFPARSKMRPAFMNAWIDSVQRDLLRGKGAQAANRRLHYGFVAPGVGYVAPATFYDTAPGLGWRQAEADYARILDHVFSSLAGSKALILDLSNNRGGSPGLARSLVSRVASVPASGARFKPVRPVDADVQTYDVEPERSRPRFDGPVYVMVSDITVSGGEFAALLLRTQPNVVIVGERTRGSLSSLTEKVLPNGWLMEMAHQSVLTPAGESFAATGIPPGEVLPVYSSGRDPFASHRSAVRAVIARIEGCTRGADSPTPCW